MRTHGATTQKTSIWLLIQIIILEATCVVFNVLVCFLLAEKLTGEKLDVPEVTQSEEGQKQKLGIVLAATNRVSPCRLTVHITNKLTY